jgi:hypothetical protein
MALKLRRGTNAERQTITPLQGELLFITDTKKLYVGDGATQGGVLVGPVDIPTFDLINDTTPQLGGNLDLNGNNVVGTGNININGTITATGNINLGDAEADSITVAGLISSDLRPAIDDTFSLGSVSRQWISVWTAQANVDNTLAVGSRIIKLSGGAEDSSTVLWDAETDTISVSNVNANTIQGNFIGSVFSDDSGTLLVDSINSLISNGRLTLRDDVIESNGEEISLDAQLILTRRFGVTGNPDDMGYVSIQSSRGTRTDLLTVESGDLLGSFTVGAYEGVPGQVTNKILITGAIDAVTGTSPLPGKILFTVQNYDGNYSTYASLNSRGVFEAPVVKTTPFNDDTARDAQILNPAPGMLVYNTTASKFQGYVDDADGLGNPGWIDLH